MILVTVTGRLTKDAEVRTSGGTGKPYVLFTVASNFLYGKRAEEAKENGQPDAIFFNVIAFGEYYANFIGDIPKGTQVTVVGDLSISYYENNNGEKVPQFSINPHKVEKVYTATDAKPWE